MGLFPEALNEKTLQRLAEALRQDRPIAFVGSGTSARARYPLWGQLMDLLEAEVKDRSLPIPPKALMRIAREPDLLWRAQEYRDHLRDEDYHQFLRATFQPNEQPIDDCLRDLVALPFRHVITTNYDRVLEDAHAEARPSERLEQFRWSDDEAQREFISRLGDPAYARRYVYLHGRWDNPASIVLTDEDYERMYVRSADTSRKLFALFATQRVVFVGFSLSDPDLMHLLREMKSDMGRGAARHFAIVPLDSWEEQAVVRRRLVGKFGIEPLFYQATADHQGLADALARLRALVSPAPMPTTEKARRAPTMEMPAVEAPRMAVGPGADVGGGGPGGGDAALASGYLQRALDLDPDDPNKGRWGGAAERAGRRLSAKVRHRANTRSNLLFRVELTVESTDPARPLGGTVVFHLHPTFVQPRVEVEARDGRATHVIEAAYGAFTVGAEADAGATRLELDLATLPDAPARFVES